MKRLVQDTLFYRITIAVLLVLVLVRWNIGLVALAVALAFELITGRRPHEAWLDSFERALPWLVAPMSIGIMMILAPKPATQLALAVGLWAWWWWSHKEPHKRWAWLVTAGLSQALLVTALFAGIALRHWSVLLVLVLVWAGSFLIAEQLLVRLEERQIRVLASAWALIVAELSWVFSVWLVSYITPGGYFIIPQATIVIMSLAYCFLSIYLAHRSGRLSRARLAEYAIIGLGLVFIVIAGTKWNGSV
jgi:hypothetical protein